MSDLADAIQHVLDTQIRPLLAVGRETVRTLVSAAGLPFGDDPTNEEPLYGRNRIRNEVLPVLREVGADPGT